MMKNKQVLWLGLIGLSVLLAACKTAPSGKSTPAGKIPPAVAATSPATVAAPAMTLFTPSTWEMLPEWTTIDLTPAWPALLQSCRVLKTKQQWQQVCAGTALVDKNDNEAQRKFYEDKLAPFQIFNSDGTENGVITGYYEPLLKGSRFKSKRFPYPLYAAPDDMLTIDLGDAYPQLKGQRLRGRLSGKRVVPYFNRHDHTAQSPNAGARHWRGDQGTGAGRFLLGFWRESRCSSRAHETAGTHVGIVS